jgi:hypothetical protein
MEAGEFGELFLREVSFGSELSDPFAEVLDQGPVEHIPPRPTKRRHPSSNQEGSFQLYALYAADQHTMRIIRSGWSAAE